MKKLKDDAVTNELMAKLAQDWRLATMVNFVSLKTVLTIFIDRPQGAINTFKAFVGFFNNKYLAGDTGHGLPTGEPVKYVNLYNKLYGIEIEKNKFKIGSQNNPIRTTAAEILLRLNKLEEALSPYVKSKFLAMTLVSLAALICFPLVSVFALSHMVYQLRRIIKAVWKLDQAVWKKCLKTALALVEMPVDTIISTFLLMLAFPLHPLFAAFALAFNALLTLMPSKEPILTKDDSSSSFGIAKSLKTAKGMFKFPPKRPSDQSVSIRSDDLEGFMQLKDHNDEDKGQWWWKKTGKSGK
jgi:hypothetical protein